MNKHRRKTINEIIDKIVDLRDLLDEVRNEEECYKDNIPENLQSSVRYEKAKNAVGILEDAVIYLDDTIDLLREVVE